MRRGSYGLDSFPIEMVDGDESAASAPWFHPIAEYGFLSDCHTGALVAPDGAVEWLCLPRFDSPSVFGAILDREAGGYRLGPRGGRIPVQRRYLPGTNVLETWWMTETGWLEVFDALTVVAGAEDPPEHDAEHLLVRVARCAHGSVEVEAVCEPAPGYGAERPGWRRLGEDGCAAELESADPPLRLLGDLQLDLRGAAARGVRRLEEDEICFSCLSWREDDGGPSDAADATGRIEATAHFWRRWLEGGSFPEHTWRQQLQRSALVLKGLGYAPSGAMVAAPTTSLPETLGGARNWDYRYTWVRDSTFALWGLHVVGFDHEAREFMRFITRVCSGRGPDPQIMFGIGGEVKLDESTLDHLEGYRDSRPVRIGNAAYTQHQNDVYGTLLDSFYIHSKTREGVPGEAWPVIRDQVEGAVAAWRKPDQGIWEARGEPKHYVSSKLMCWVALDRGARLAREHGEREHTVRWEAEARKVREDLLEHGVSERGVFRQHYDTDALDASTLLVPLTRFLPPDDRRIRATVEAIGEDLTENGFVLRYRPDETDDGLGGAGEGAFMICSFWLVSALSEIGERERARALCERLLGCASPLGLYAEELDSRSGAHLGNFPQAFTHLALINAVSHVIADDLLGEREGPTAVFSEIRAPAT